MGKYRTKSKFVDAEQFHCKPTHPSFPENTPTCLPNGVIQKRFTDYQDPAPYYKWGIETKSGFIEIRDKDWIVTERDGSVSVMNDVAFRSEYEGVITIKKQ